MRLRPARRRKRPEQTPYFTGKPAPSPLADVRSPTRELWRPRVPRPSMRTRRLLLMEEVSSAEQSLAAEVRAAAERSDRRVERDAERRAAAGRATDLEYAAEMATREQQHAFVAQPAKRALDATHAAIAADRASAALAAAEPGWLAALRRAEQQAFVTLHTHPLHKAVVNNSRWRLVLQMEDCDVPMLEAAGDRWREAAASHLRDAMRLLELKHGAALPEARRGRALADGVNARDALGLLRELKAIEVAALTVEASANPTYGALQRAALARQRELELLLDQAARDPVKEAAQANALKDAAREEASEARRAADALRRPPPPPRPRVGHAGCVHEVRNLDVPFEVRLAEVEALVEDRRRHGPQLRHAYNELLKDCRRRAAPHEANAALDSMMAHDVRPDTTSFTLAIYAAKAAAEVAPAFATVERMPRARLEPTLGVFHALIEACRAARAWRRALSVFPMIVAARLAPTTATYSLLAEACKAAPTGDAPLVYEALKRVGVPDYLCYSFAALLVS